MAEPRPRLSRLLFEAAYIGIEDHDRSDLEDVFLDQAEERLEGMTEDGRTDVAAELAELMLGRRR